MSGNEMIHKRDYSKYHYIVIQLRKANPGNQLDSADSFSIAANKNDLCSDAVNKISGGILVDSGVGQVLDDHCVVAIQKHSTNPQIPSAVLEKRAILEVNKQDDPLLLNGSSIIWAEEQIPRNHLYKRTPIPPPSQDSVVIQEIRKALDLKDPGFSRQWHLVNPEGFDLNVTGVWKQGITGENVTVGFIDDGLDHENPDLKENFSLEGSWDYNEHKQLPTPKLWDDTHGTRCAGEVSAVKNGVCGVGVAYKSKAAGIRILSGELTHEDEARAITFACNTTQIYSCSWGPRDDGKTMENPPDIVSRAFRNGIDSCRNGLGSIYVFAAGNGGVSDDNCNADGYTNSIYTITVAAMDNLQNHPKYSERCSAILISMYSNYGLGMDGIYTTDWKNGCTDAHGGTSAAAPLASGIYALVLSKRPDLSWRDVQRLSIESAIIVNPTDADWIKNGAGRKYNHQYGYGTFDTYSLLENAKVYKNVGPQIKCVISSLPDMALPIPGQSSTGINQTFTVNSSVVNGMKRLEHVEVTVLIKHPNRGEIALNLISPSGFVSRIMEPRKYDHDGNGFNNWRMMSVAHWDENPIGDWMLVIIDNDSPSNAGTLEKWSLTLWGEKETSPSSTSVIPPLNTLAPPSNDTNTYPSPPSKSVQSSSLEIIKDSTETLTIFSFIFFGLIIAVIAYVAIARGASRRLFFRGYRHRKVVLEKEINDENINLQDYDDEQYDLLVQDVERGIQENEVLFQRSLHD